MCLLNGNAVLVLECEPLCKSNSSRFEHGYNVKWGLKLKLMCTIVRAKMPINTRFVTMKLCKLSVLNAITIIVITAMTHESANF